MSTATTEVRSAEASKSPVMTHRQIMLVIIGLMAGMFLSSLDQTIVSTAIRTIGDDLHGLEQQAWVTTAYMITSTITTPIYGKLSDMYGRRPLYIFGIIVFILGSLLSTFSTSMAMLAAFRAFQGIGAGALMSLPMAIMGDMLAPRERAKYQGYFLAIFGISSVIGPLVGGLFAGADSIFWITGWRWVFLVNVPIGLVALAMVWKFLRLPSFGEAKAKPRVDWWGATFVVVALVPLLLVAEQGREWGWASATSITCYVVSAVGLLAFILTESRMGNDAIIPLRLFRSKPFSMATILGTLVGFGMFGAMMTIPLFLQIVLGLTPTESGFATLPMMAGIMLSSIVSGILVSKTGSYRIFPITGTFLVACGYFYLTFMTIDRPLWFLMIGMFIIGLGLGQLMQSLTLAAQNAVAPSYMGVATSAATFFRQIGGTMGTAILLSILFSVMPTNITHAMSNEGDLRNGLDAALNPTVATAPANQGVMDQMWNNIVNPVKSNIQTQLDGATEQINSKIPAGTPAEVRAQALNSAAEQAHASVIDGKLAVDWSDDAERGYWVDQLAPKMAEEVANKVDSEDTNSDASASTSDTSYLNGADARLTRPFMEGFNESTLAVYRVGLGVILAAFVLTLFFKVPPLRNVSGLQESADAADEAAAENADKQRDLDREGAVLHSQVKDASTGALPVQVIAAATDADKAKDSVTNNESEAHSGALSTDEATVDTANQRVGKHGEIRATEANESGEPVKHAQPRHTAAIEETETPAGFTRTTQPTAEALLADSTNRRRDLPVDQSPLKKWLPAAGISAAALASGGVLFSVLRRRRNR